MRSAPPTRNVDQFPPDRLPARRSPGPDKDSPFYVPSFLDLLGGLVDRFRTILLGLGRLETSLLQEQLAAISVSKPVYVCGLARSGSTLLHQIVASAPGVATHRVKDYPMAYTPYWWRQATARRPPTAPRERVHRDRILISPESPDAVEEMLWMAFFPRCHDPSVSNRLAAGDSHPATLRRVIASSYIPPYGEDQSHLIPSQTRRSNADRSHCVAK